MTVTLSAPKVTYAVKNDATPFPTRTEVTSWLTELEDSILNSIPDYTDTIGNILARLDSLETLLAGATTSINENSGEIDVLGTRVAQNETAIMDLESSTGGNNLFVFDSNNQCLGLLVKSSNTGVKTVFNNTLGKIIDFNEDGTIDKQGVNYTDPNCTPGAGYFSSGPIEEYLYYDFLFHIGADRYGYIHPDAEPQLVTFVATLSSDGTCNSTAPTTKAMYQVVETTTPYANDVRLPFDVRYQDSCSTNPTTTPNNKTIVFANDRPQPFDSDWHKTSGYNWITIDLTITGYITQYDIHYNTSPITPGYTVQQTINCGNGTVCPQVKVPILGDYYRISTGTASGNVTAIGKLEL